MKPGPATGSKTICILYVPINFQTELRPDHTMGGIFSKKPESRITEQDRAVLGLKKQRDQLKQYQKRINNDLEKEKELARKLLKAGKKDRAKLLLRKKKFQEGLLEKTDSQLDQLERLVHDIEFAQVQKQVLDGLKNGNVALEKANAMFSVDEIEDIFADTQEAVDRQAEINSLLSGELTEVRDCEQYCSAVQCKSASVTRHTNNTSKTPQSVCPVMRNAVY